jgi:hypothetical protein
VPCGIKGFSMSKNTAAVDILLLKLRVTWSVSLMYCSVVLWVARKPNWLALSRLLSSICFGEFLELLFRISELTIQSQSHIATDGQSISKSWCRAPSGAHDQIFITLWQLRSWFCGAPSLTRGRVCLLHMLLALASVVFLGSDSVGTRDCILLSQIWDFLNLQLTALVI